jgi:hypothetical protein
MENEPENELSFQEVDTSVQGPFSEAVPALRETYQPGNFLLKYLQIYHIAAHDIISEYKYKIIQIYTNNNAPYNRTTGIFVIGH